MHIDWLRARQGAPLGFALFGAGLLAAGCGDGVSPPTAARRVAPPAYVGAWAVRPALCGKAEWRIAPTALLADSGPACVFQDPRPNATSWTVTATCEDGDRRVLELNPAPTEPATLVISGGPWGPPVTLVRCSAPGGEAPTRDPHSLLEMASRTDLALARGGPEVSLVRDPANAITRAVWRRDGEIVKVVEPIIAAERSLGERHYYFRPGERQPFLIRDPQGAFGFFQGTLVTSFSPEGEILDSGATPNERAETFMRRSRMVLGLAEVLKAP